MMNIHNIDITKNIIESKLCLNLDSKHVSFEKSDFKLHNIKIIENKNLTLYCGKLSNHFNPYCSYKGICGSVFLLVDNEYYVVDNIDSFNLFYYIGKYGVENGILNGNYSICLSYNNVVTIIENSDSIFKRKVSDIYYNNTNFTRNFKPGHLYISKNQQLFAVLSINNNVYINKSMSLGNFIETFFYGYLGDKKSLTNYSCTPKKGAYILNVHKSDFYDINHFKVGKLPELKLKQEDRIIDRLENKITIAPSYLRGKDLGLVIDNPEDLLKNRFDKFINSVQVCNICNPFYNKLMLEYLLVNFDTIKNNKKFKEKAIIWGNEVRNLGFRDREKTFMNYIVDHYSDNPELLNLKNFLDKNGN